MNKKRSCRKKLSYIMTTNILWWFPTLKDALGKSSSPLPMRYLNALRISSKSNPIVSLPRKTVSNGY